MTIVEKAAYLKGLTDGLGFEPDSREARLWGALNDLLCDVGHKLEELEQGFDAHEEAFDNVYDQLIELQEIAVSEEDWDAWEDEDDDDASALYAPSLRLYEGEQEDAAEAEGEADGAEAEESDALEPGDEELEYDGVLYDVTCPSCGETITIGEETLEEGRISCPNCGETLEFDLGEDE